MEVINLNFIPSGANPVAHASQFDEGRTTRFNLFDGSAVYTLDGTEIITVSVRKPDGHIVTESVTNTSSTYVEVVTTEQMTACAGDNLAQIKVEKGGDTIGFLNYILSVQKDPEDGGDPSASFIHDLETQVADMVATEVANQYDSANVIFDNDPTTGHGVGYAVTSEGVKNAIDAITPAASSVSYDNTGSGMTATNVQDAIDELDTNVGSLSTLTTTVKSSLVGAVNEAYSYKSGDTITLTNFFTPCVYDANRLRAIINLPKAVRNCSFSCSYLEVYINSTDSVQTNNITNTEVNPRTPNQLWVQFTGNFTNVSNNNAGIAVISGTITFT